MWGNNKAWRSQARIPEPGQPSCLHRTPPGELWRDGHEETEARSSAGLTRLLDNAHREPGALPLCVSPDPPPLQQPGHRRGHGSSSEPKTGLPPQGPLASPGQHLQSQGHPALTLGARGHRGASATPPSSRLLPMRLCPPPKISCSPAVPSPATPRSPGSSASTRSGSVPIPRRQRGKGIKQPPPSLTPRLPPASQRCPGAAQPRSHLCASGSQECARGRALGRLHRAETQHSL